MDQYHHGDLRRQLLDQAAAIAAETGLETVTLRELARRTGVSHSAPVHHFGSRRQLLTELAVRGFAALNLELESHADDIYEMGAAYVTWALDHAGEYLVMWQPDALSDTHPGLIAERERAWSLLAVATATQMSTSEEQTKAAAYASFSLVHGLTSLWLNKALPWKDDPTALIRSITHFLRFSTDPSTTAPDQSGL